MTNLVRWDPFREMSLLRNNMNRLFDDAFGNLPQERSGENGTYGMALDVSEDEESYTVQASLPGVSADAIDVTLNDNVLTIRGEMRDENETKQQNYHLRERRYGVFSRSISLPASTDADNIDATHDNGVLTLRIPKAEQAKPRKISVKAS